MRTTEVSEEEKEEMGSLFKEIIAENFSNIGRDSVNQVHKANELFNYLNQNDLLQVILQ